MIRIEINKLSDKFLNTDDINNIYYIKNKRVYKIENNSELNNIISKNIQDENKVNTTGFLINVKNYLTIDEQVENDEVWIFCKNVTILKMYYNESFILLKKWKKFMDFKGNKMSLTDENFRKEFLFLD